MWDFSQNCPIITKNYRRRKKKKKKIIILFMNSLLTFFPMKREHSYGSSNPDRKRRAALYIGLLFMLWKVTKIGQVIAIWKFTGNRSSKEISFILSIRFLKTHSLFDIFQVRTHECAAAEGLNFVGLSWKFWVFSNHPVATQSLIWLLN